MRSGTHIEIEVEAADGSTVGETFLTKDANEALAFVRGNLRPGITVVLACLGNGIDHGNFVIEAISPNHFNLRALEHRGFAVTGVSVEHAFGALEYWLPRQERTPALTWQDE